MKRSKFFYEKKAKNKPHIYLSSRYQNSYCFEQWTDGITDLQIEACLFCRNVKSPASPKGSRPRPADWGNRRIDKLSIYT